jgi:hypothetical protein
LLYIEEILYSRTARERLNHYRSFEDAVDDWCKRGVVKGGGDYIRFDGWGRPFEWKVSKVDGKTVIRVNSKGPDGISQNGKGDDFFLEIRIGNDGRIETTLPLVPAPKKRKGQ